MDSIKQFRDDRLEMFSANSEFMADIVDELLYCHSMFSKQLPPEIANGMTNLLYVTVHPKATTEDMENAVVKYDLIYLNFTPKNAHSKYFQNFLYSNETVVIENPLRNVQEPRKRHSSRIFSISFWNWFKFINFVVGASDCPNSTNRYSDTQDRLKALPNIKPSILQDVAIIIEKFPCGIRYVPHFLDELVSFLKFRSPKTKFK